MQDAFLTLVFIVAALAAGVAVYALATSGRSYREIGRGGFEPPAGEPASAVGATGERDQEIRQMLDARNARRDRRGEAPVDLDGEIAAISAPAPAGDVRDEVRAVVEARNRVRARSGLEPLDVDAEIARRLRELN